MSTVQPSTGSDPLTLTPVAEVPIDPRSPERFLRTDHLKGNLKAHTVRGGLLTVISQVVKQGLGVFSTIIMARLLLPQDNGLVNMVTVITGFIELFNDMGLSAATIQRDKVTHEQVSTLFWINIATGILLSLITIALAPMITWFYSEPRLFWVTVVIGSDFFYGGVTVQHRALMRRQMRFKALMVIDILSSVVSVGAGVVAALAGLGYWALVIKLIASAPVDILGTWIACPWKPSLPRRTSGLRSMLAFGGNLTGFRLVNYLARNIDNLLIGRLYGPLPLGLYNKAYGLLLLPLRKVNEPIAAVAVPALSRLVDDPPRYRAAYERIVSNLCLLTMPLVAFMIGASDWLILVVLGPQWADAARMFALLGISGLVEPFAYTTGWLFVSQARTREQLHWGVISTVMMIGAIIAGLPWGPVGVALAYGVMGLIRTPLLFWFVGRSGPVRTADLYRGVVPFVVTVVAILLALGAFRLFAAGPDPLLNLLAATAISGVVGLATLLASSTGRAALRELRMMPTMLVRK